MNLPYHPTSTIKITKNNETLFSTHSKNFNISLKITKNIFSKHKHLKKTLSHLYTNEIGIPIYIFKIEQISQKFKFISQKLEF